ncbi:MAG: hypothetical protein K2J15_04420 [Muribaculaceae bacterium]|nr:hypothetical protein [Muribaculaceae bacterium]
MKTSTKILIYTGIGALICAFFTPAVTLSRDNNIPSATDYNMKKMNVCDTIPMGNFSKIDVLSFDYDMSLESYTFPVLTIREVEGLDSPRMIVDRSWKGNLSAECDTMVLTIKFPMTEIRKQLKSNQSIIIDDDNDLIATIEVPSDYVRTVNSPWTHIHLSHLKDAHIAIDRCAEYSADSCSFNSLTFISYR